MNKLILLIINIVIIIVYPAVSFSENCNELYNLSKKYSNKDKNYYLAIETAKKIDANCPNYLKVKINIVRIYNYGLKDDYNAYIHAKEIINLIDSKRVKKDLAPDIADIYGITINYLKNKGMKKEAEKLSKILIEFSQNNNLPDFKYRGHLWLGEFQRNKRNFDEALKNYSVATNINRKYDKIYAYIYVAVAYHALRKYDLMPQVLKKAETILTNSSLSKEKYKKFDYEIQYWLGIYYYNIGEKEKSKPLLSYAIKDNEIGISSKDRLWFYQRFNMKKEAFKMLKSFQGIDRIKYLIGNILWFYKIPAFIILALIIAFFVLKRRKKYIAMN